MWYFIGAIIIILAVISALYLYFLERMKRIEQKIISIFLLKVSKIPALIEVMRDFVADEWAFDSLINMHSDAMTRKFESIYALLEHNARIHNGFLFLMKLSVQIPDLQKNESFIYIRDFIIKYERDIKNNFSDYNKEVDTFNAFVNYKNFSIVGLILPFKKRQKI